MRAVSQRGNMRVGLVLILAAAAVGVSETNVTAEPISLCVERWASAA